MYGDYEDIQSSNASESAENDMEYEEDQEGEGWKLGGDGPAQTTYRRKDRGRNKNQMIYGDFMEAYSDEEEDPVRRNTQQNQPQESEEGNFYKGINEKFATRSKFDKNKRQPPKQAHSKSGNQKGPTPSRPARGQNLAFRKGEQIHQYIGQVQVVLADGTKKNAQDLQTDVGTKLGTPSMFGRKEKVGERIRKTSLLFNQQPMEQEPEEIVPPPKVGAFSLQSFLQHSQKLHTIGEQEDSNQSGSVSEQANNQSHFGLGFNQNKKVVEAPTVQPEPQVLNEKVLKSLQLEKLGMFGQRQRKDPQKQFQQHMEGLYQSKKQPKVPPKTKQQRDKEKQFISSYGVGYKMLSKMGFSNVLKGLGKDETGIVAPVEAVNKRKLSQRDKAQRQNRKRPVSSDQDVFDVDEDDGGKERRRKKEEEPPSIDQQLFSYYSRHHKINDFLMDLKNSFDKVQFRMSSITNEMEEQKKRQQVEENHKVIRQAQLGQIQSKVHGLEATINILNSFQTAEKTIIEKNGQKAQEKTNFKQATLLLQNKVDMALARRLYDQLKGMDAKTMCMAAEGSIKHTKLLLTQLFLARQSEQLLTIRQYTNAAAEKPQLIQLDEWDEKRVTDLIGAVLEGTCIRKVGQVLSSVRSIERIEHWVIDVTKICCRYCPAAQILLVDSAVLPLMKQYFSGFEVPRNGKLMPHLIVFPWFQVVLPHKIPFKALLSRLMCLNWTIKEKTLLGIIEPILKFLTPQDRIFIVQGYVAPRLLRQLEDFRLGQDPNSGADSNKQLIKGFLLYSPLLPSDVREQILRQTVILEIVRVYHLQLNTIAQSDLTQWIGGWIRTLGRACPGLLEDEFKQHGLII